MHYFILITILLTIVNSQEFINDFEMQLFKLRQQHLSIKETLSLQTDSVFNADRSLSGVVFKGKICWLRKTLGDESKLDDQVRFNIGRFLYAIEGGELNFVNVVIQRQGLEFSDMAFATKLNDLLRSRASLNLKSISVIDGESVRKVNLQFPGLELDVYFKSTNAKAGDRFYQAYEDDKFIQLIDCKDTDFSYINDFDYLDDFSDFFGYDLINEESEKLTNVFYKQKERYTVTQLDMSFLKLWRQKNQLIENLLQGIESITVQINTKKKANRKFEGHDRILTFFSNLLNKKKIYCYLMKDEKQLAVIIKDPNYLFYHQMFLYYYGNKMSIDITPNISY